MLKLENAPLTSAPRSALPVPRRSDWSQVILVACTAILIASVVSYSVAAWIGLPRAAAIYRRIGPQTGPQVFCEGSSVVQFGLSWPEISAALGQGIENWGVGGSSPSEWEVSQRFATDTNLMIIGVSVDDLNEYYLCDSHANIVSVAQTIQDLWRSKADWQFASRVLSQYPRAYLRVLFPTAGRSETVLVGLRRKVRKLTGSSPTAGNNGNFLVLPKEPVLSFGDLGAKLSEWPADKTLRRLDELRGEIHNAHWFEGPKHLAFLRMLDRARQRGRVIVAVAPLAPMYLHHFVTPEVAQRFENALAEAQRAVPQAEFIRLDQLPALNSDEYYSDLIHLNGAGKRIATEAFLKELSKDSRLP
jgi:hypothetical protein